MPDGDILQTLKEVMKEKGTVIEKRPMDKIAMLRRCFIYATDLLDIILSIQRDRRNRWDYW